MGQSPCATQAPPVPPGRRYRRRQDDHDRPSELMRRMVKVSLLNFDGTPLFPERVAYTMPYKLSDDEAPVDREVTDYIRPEFNRAEALANDKRAGIVGFPLTIPERRLAS